MTPHQAQVKLQKMIAYRDRLMNANNKLAATRPAFAQRLHRARLDGLDQRAAVAVSQATAGCCGQGMGFFGGVALGSVAIIAVVTAIAIVYWQIRREEQQLAQESPFQYAMAQAGSMLTTMTVLAVVGFGAWVYYDYRKGGGEFLSQQYREDKLKKARAERQKLSREIERLRGREQGANIEARRHFGMLPPRTADDYEAVVLDDEDE
jgi:hypothetical protein